MNIPGTPMEKETSGAANPQHPLSPPSTPGAALGSGSPGFGLGYDDHNEPPIAGAFALQQSDHASAMKTVEELEDELARLRLAAAAGGTNRLGSPTATPARREPKRVSVPIYSPVFLSDRRAVPPTNTPLYPYGRQEYGEYPTRSGGTGQHADAGYRGDHGYPNPAGPDPLRGFETESAPATQFEKERAYRSRDEREFSMEQEVPDSFQEGVPGDAHQAHIKPGDAFSDMLASERGPNPFRGGQTTARLDSLALSPKGAASRASERVRDPHRTSAQTERLAGQFDYAFSKQANGTKDLGAILGVGETEFAADAVGAFCAARSRRVSRRKFVCEIDGKAFSTMNLMRVHFDLHYAHDAEVWWNTLREVRG